MKSKTPVRHTIDLNDKTFKLLKKAKKKYGGTNNEIIHSALLALDVLEEEE